jgi:uridine kinase
MGEIRCRINIHGNVREYVPETTYKQLAKEYKKQFSDDIVLVLVNNRLRELREKVESGNLTWELNTWLTH